MYTVMNLIGSKQAAPGPLINIKEWPPTQNIGLFFHNSIRTVASLNQRPFLKSFYL